MLSEEQLEKEYIKVTEYDNEFLTLCQARADYLVWRERKNLPINLDQRAYGVYIRNYVAKVQLEEYRSKRSNVTSVVSENNSNRLIATARAAAHDEIAQQSCKKDTDCEAQKTKFYATEKTASVANEYLYRHMLFSNDLYNAVYKGNNTELERLVSGRTGIHYKSINGITILFIAVHEGHWNVVLFLLLYQGESLFGYTQHVS